MKIPSLMYHDVVEPGQADASGFPGGAAGRVNGAAAPPLAVDLQSWPGIVLCVVDDRVVAQALARSERRVAKVRKRAETRPSPENTHRWRRRVRRLRMQWEFQHKAAKALGGPGQPGSQTYKPTHRALSKLSDALGATQDLRELRKTLRSLGDPDTVAPLLVEIDRERKKQNAVVP